MLKKSFYIFLFSFLAVCVSSCSTSVNPMYDSYIDYHYPNRNNLKVHLFPAKLTKGFRNTFVKYYKLLPNVEKSLLVITNSSYEGNSHFFTNIHFILDNKYHLSFTYNSNDLDPKEITERIKKEQNWYGFYYFDFIVNYIKDNGFENLGKITEHENCDLSRGMGTTTIVLFDKNLEVTNSYYFANEMKCSDKERFRSILKKHGLSD